MANKMICRLAHRLFGHEYDVLTISRDDAGKVSIAWEKNPKMSDQLYQITGLTRSKFEEKLMTEVKRLQSEGQDVFTFLPKTLSNYWIWFVDPEAV